MDNVLFVRGFDAVNQLLDDGQRVIEVHGTAQQRCSQILSLDILHDQIVRPNVVQMADIRVVESHNRAGFAGEALCECALDTLIATSRSSRESWARYTSPMPPAPMGARILYGPSSVPAESGISLIQLSVSDQRAGIGSMRDLRSPPAHLIVGTRRRSSSNQFNTTVT
jgi:hypothetical protein